MGSTHIALRGRPQVRLSRSRAVLRMDRDFNLTLLRECADAGIENGRRHKVRTHIHRPLLEQRDFAIAALEVAPLMLYELSPRLRSDPAIVDLAVRRDGRVLRVAPL